jgi:hypothetical protein
MGEVHSEIDLINEILKDLVIILNDMKEIQETNYENIEHLVDFISKEPNHFINNDIHSETSMKPKLQKRSFNRSKTLICTAENINDIKDQKML